MLNIPCFQLNIRQKIILGMILFSLCFGGIAALSYFNIVKVEKKVMLVEKADDFSNVILEIRRLEKNYFLYGNSQCVEQSRTYIHKGLDLLITISRSLHAQRDIGVRIKALEKELDHYNTLLTIICTSKQSDGRYKENLAAQLRQSGQRLVEQSKKVTTFERGDILRINSNIRNNIFLSILVALTLVIVLIFFVTKNVIAPLKLLEDSSKAIGQGTFTPLAVKNTHDEIQRVIMAFNSMVNELAKRQDQLVQAQKLSSLGTLTSGIAHQLNNPLNNISTSCQILSEELGQITLEAFAEKLLHNIGQETNRARDIVKGLLEFSRNQEFSIAPNNLLQTVAMGVKLVSSQLPSNISIVTDIPEEMILLMDRQKMNEVFLNLIMNAIQAIQPDKGEITITATQKKDTAHIKICDTGSGISPEHVDQIFDPFYTTKDVGNGTGLGLSVAYGIIKKHRGTIIVTSTPGEGTCFNIKLPMANTAD